MAESTSPQALQYVDAPLEECWQVVQDYATFIVESKSGGFDYESDIPHPRDVLIVCFVRILRELDFSTLDLPDGLSPEEAYQRTNSALAYAMNAIPDEETYKARHEAFKLSQE